MSGDLANLSICGQVPADLRSPRRRLTGRPQRAQGLDLDDEGLEFGFGCEHDDLVLAVALAVWRAARFRNVDQDC